MKTKVQRLTDQDTIRRAAEVMRKGNVGFLPIVDSAKRVVGVITDRDLVIRAIAEGLSLDTALSVCMTDSVLGCATDDDVRVAAARMAETKRSRLVVLDEHGQLAGVISMSDLVDVLGGPTAAATAREIAHRDGREDAPSHF
jgi:CBS domain-containing protein